MSREKDRKLRRRQRRRWKLQKLKKRLADATNLGERQFLVDKISRISLNPKQDVPKRFHDMLETS